MFRALRHAFSTRIVALTLVAMSSCTLGTDVSGPAAVIRFSGDEQTAPVNTTLTTPLAVAVVNQVLEPLPNITVTWTIISGGGTLSAASTQTDESGIASVTYKTGDTAGPVVIEAEVRGLPTVVFNITVT
ncbi:MAG: Ig-like domain-containing protein [Gemmatimonadota bacterium]|nr:Ig-like domain-containing protein [Gemmatimonadota bacterium]